MDDDKQVHVIALLLISIASIVLINKSFWIKASAKCKTLTQKLLVHLHLSPKINQ